MNKLRGKSLLVALLFVLTVLVQAKAATLLVVCKSDFKLVLVDPATMQVVARLPTDPGPHEVAISPDGRTAYVSDFGRYSVYPEDDTAHDKAGNTITVIDVTARKVKAIFNLGTHRGPHGFAFSHDGKRMWVTSETPQSVLEIDPATGTILHSWETTQERSHMIVVTPDETKFYVTNTVSGSVTVINRMTGATKVLPTGAGTEGITIAPDGQEVWAANRLDGKVSVISTASDSIVAAFPSGGKEPKRLAFTPDGAQVWITNFGSDQTTIFDARTRLPLYKISMAKAPSSIEITPDGLRAYITNAYANELTVVDVPARSVISTLAIGTDPDGVAWTMQ